MWFTQGHQLYAAFSQSGIQKLFNSVFTARPHYFNYATSALGGGTPGVSSLSPIQVPGCAAGVDYKLQFPSVPLIEFYPEAIPPPPPPQPGPVPQPPIPPLPKPYAWTLNQFVVYAILNVDVLQPPQNLVSGSLAFWAFGHPQLNTAASGSTISLVIDEIEVSDAGTLGLVVDYVSQLMLNGLLSNLQIPTGFVAQGALSFKLEAGPAIGSQQLQVWGSLA